MERMTTAEAQQRFNEVCEKLRESHDLFFEISHLKRLLARAKETKNVTWENELREKLRGLMERYVERKKLTREYKRLYDELMKHVDPKDPGFHGPVYEVDLLTAARGTKLSPSEKISLIR